MKIPIEICHINKDIRKKSLEKKGIKRIEEVAARYYKKKGFKVYNLYLKEGQHSLINNIKKNKVKTNIPKNKIIKSIKTLGRFDLFCYKTKKNYFFSEVKKIPNDKPQYHENQITWIKKYHNLLKNRLTFIFIVPKYWHVKEE